MSLNKDMGDAHEAYLADRLDGRQAKGSGNQWRHPMDGRHSRYGRRFAFAWDGKSTLGKSISVTRDMVAKAREQAGGERPMLALRFYADEKLRVDADWIAVQAEDFAEMLKAANTTASARTLIAHMRDRLEHVLGEEASNTLLNGEMAALRQEAQDWLDDDA